jgi:hypothetical protein
MHTLEAKPSAMVLEIVDSTEKDLHMQNKLLRHPDGIQVLPIADLPQHIRYARSTGFLKSRKDAGKATLNTLRIRVSRSLTSRFGIPTAPFSPVFL